MTTLREAAQEFVADYDCGGCGHYSANAENFRKLLAQEAQEPAIYPAEAREMGLEEVAFYTHPPRREWQGLTEEEMEDLLPLYSDPNADAEMLEFAIAIEAALKEKNHD